MAKLQLRILTADNIKLDEPVDMVIMRCLLEEMGENSAMGEIGILPGHVPLEGVLGINPLRIFDEGNERVMALFGGVVTVRDNVVTLMTERALWPDEIDQDQAKADLQEAERALEAAGPTNNNRTNRIALRKAKAQIEVVSRASTGRR